jgi:hypothetical protein
MRKRWATTALHEADEGGVVEPEKTEQKRVVVETPSVRSEMFTERTHASTEAGQSSISMGMVSVIAIVSIGAIGIMVYLVTNRNTTKLTNPDASVVVAGAPSPAPVTTIIEQPAPVQPGPVIIQQPASQAPVIIQQPAAPAPVIVQQSVPSGDVVGAGNDRAMQDIATRKLSADHEMSSISITVIAARAVLTGTANSQATKARAENLVKEVRGLKSVDNKIFVAGEE